MAYQSANLSADGIVKISNVHIPRGQSYYSGVIMAGGTFGDGTVSLELSDTNGDTTYTVKDVHGDPILLTANGAANFRIFGDGNTNDAGQNLELYVKLNGATGANVTVKLYDNR